MRRSICWLIVVLGAWSASLAQNAPKLTHPRIVATFEQLNQTRPIQPLTLYTPSVTGTFRCSVVMVLTKANGNQVAAWRGGFLVLDASGANGPLGVQLYTENRNTASTEFPIAAIAGKPIRFRVDDLYGGADGTKYNVWVVVEQLM